MRNYKYLIIGGGMSGDMAVRGIREVDETGSIGMITTEPYGPYDRPPLSKGLWSGDQDLSDIDRETVDLGVDIFTNTEATALNRESRTVATATAGEFSYEKLLLAMGGTTRTLAQGADGIFYYRTREDFEALRAATETPKTIGVIGGGYIGSELAASLQTQGHSVQMIFPDATLLGRIFPKDIGNFLNEEFSRRGIEIFAEHFVDQVVKTAQGYQIRTTNGATFDVDVVVAGLGIIPNTQLAENAGLEVSNGIHVNEFLQTSDPNIYAAGDIANIYCEPLGVRRRVEHEQAANRSGKYAGLAMAGQAKSIATFIPMFYSDAFDISWEGVGETSNDLDIVQNWEEPFKKGAIYFLRDGQDRGAIMWNTWGKLKGVRQLIRDKQAP